MEEVRAYLRQEISALKDDPRAAEELNALSVHASPPSRVFEALIRFVDNALMNWPRNSQNPSQLQNSGTISASETFGITAGDLHGPATEQTASFALEPAYGIEFTDHTNYFIEFGLPQDPEPLADLSNAGSFLYTLIDPSDQVMDHKTAHPHLEQSTDVDQVESGSGRGPKGAN
jgi:hypothetical protein